MRQSDSSPILSSLNNVCYLALWNQLSSPAHLRKPSGAALGGESLTGSDQTLDDLGPSAEEIAFIKARVQNVA